ncbi:MAG: winged helix-turn-helix transcriptional regulator [Candidatus Levybacteria bacterium]|nr:winged helix-turn-helix transcriptional regulator [Candidatus Levybacteria bacterium]
MRSKEQQVLVEKLPNLAERPKVKTERSFAEFPQEPDERLEVLLLSFVESKRSVDFLLIPDLPNYITTEDFWRNFLDVYAGTELSGLDKKSHLRVANKIPYQHGLSSKFFRQFGENIVVGFTRTESGRKYGVPAACLSLDFEKRTGISLTKVFGHIKKPTSAGLTTQYIRAKILEYLSQQEFPVREIDIARNLKLEQSHAKDIIYALSVAGVIDYEAVGLTVAPQTTFRLGEGALPDKRLPHSSWKLSTQLIEICRNLGENGQLITLIAVLDLIPDEIRQHYNQNSLTAGIRSVFSSLENLGFLARVGKFKHGERESAASLNSTGRIVFSEFLKPYLGIVNDDRKVHETVSSTVVPVVLGQLPQHGKETLNVDLEFLQLYKQRREIAAEKRRQILELLKEEPKSINELSSQVGLHRAGVMRFLNSLVKEGRVMVSVNGKPKYYSLAKQKRGEIKAA